MLVFLLTLKTFNTPTSVKNRKSLILPLSTSLHILQKTSCFAFSHLLPEALIRRRSIRSVLFTANKNLHPSDSDSHFITVSSVYWKPPAMLIQRLAPASASCCRGSSVGGFSEAPGRSSNRLAADAAGRQNNSNNQHQNIDAHINIDEG